MAICCFYWFLSWMENWRPAPSPLPSLPESSIPNLELPSLSSQWNHLRSFVCLFLNNPDALLQGNEIWIPGSRAWVEWVGKPPRWFSWASMGRIATLNRESVSQEFTTTRAICFASVSAAISPSSKGGPPWSPKSQWTKFGIQRLLCKFRQVPLLHLIWWLIYFYWLTLCFLPQINLYCFTMVKLWNWVIQPWIIDIDSKNVETFKINSFPKSKIS